MARVLYRVGVPDDHSITRAPFSREIGALLDRFRAQKLDEIDAGAVLPELLDLAVRYRIRVPKDYALLSRAAVSTEGILRQLDPQMDIALSGAAARAADTLLTLHRRIPRSEACMRAAPGGC